jgi:hypothetical protein
MRLEFALVVPLQVRDVKYHADDDGQHKQPRPGIELADEQANA